MGARRTSGYVKEYVAARCQRVQREQVRILKEVGHSYREIEEILNLRPNEGMTAWRFIKNHKE